MILGNAGLHCRALSLLRLQALLLLLFACYVDATHGCSRVMECSTMWFWLWGFGIRCCRRDASKKRVLSIGGWFCRVEDCDISSASLHDTAHSLSIAGVEASKSQHTELLLLVFCDFNWEDVDGLDTTESDHNDCAPCCRSWVSFRLALPAAPSSISAPCSSFPTLHPFSFASHLVITRFGRASVRLSRRTLVAGRQGRAS